MTLAQLAPILREPPPLVHLTGITPALSPACDKAVGELMVKLQSATSAVSFDVNLRAGLWSPTVAAPRLEALAQQADVVFVGLDEAATLWRTGTPESVRSLIDRPSILVVNNGEQGATAFHERGSDFVPALKLEVCEAVGAGDAFAAGWLSGWLQNLPHKKRLRLGHLLASLALGSTADHRALPSRPELQSALSLSDNEWAGLKLTARPESPAPQERPFPPELEER
jgi:2-dehydro-3-deoxygluconokinase